jgi:lipopolysaccharide export system protein LptA
MLLRLFVVLLASATWQISHALDSDAEQPATLDADDMEMDFSSGVRIYRGNVVFRQGSIKMTCDELTTYFSGDGELDKAICIGSPGSFKQRPEGQEHDLVGTAMTITMDQVEQLVTLKSQAKVVQGNSTITGRIITYNLVTEKANIKGGGTQSTGTSSSSQDSDAGISDDSSGETPGAEESVSTEAQQEEENSRPSLVIQPRKIKEVEGEQDRNLSHWIHFQHVLEVGKNGNEKKEDSAE